MWNILFAGTFVTLWKNALITLIHESSGKFAGKYVNQMKSYSHSNWLIGKRISLHIRLRDFGRTRESCANPWLRFEFVKCAVQFEDSTTPLPGKRTGILLPSVSREWGIF